MRTVAAWHQPAHLASAKNDGLELAAKQFINSWRFRTSLGWIPNWKMD